MAEKIVVDVDFQTNAKETTTELDDLKTELEGIKGELTALKDAEKKTSGALGKLSKGFKGMGLAMKAMGVGLIIEAFGFLKEIMMKNQAIMSAVSVATETIGVVFNQLASVVTDVIDAVSESSEGFEGIQKVITGLMTIALTPLKMGFYALKLGIQEAQLVFEEWFGGNDDEDVKRLTEQINETKGAIAEVGNAAIEAGKQVADNIAEAVTEIGSVISIASEVAEEGIKSISIAAALETGKALAQAKGQLELIEVLRAKQQFQSQLDAEIQRQIRDDVSKTFAERIEANEELGRILDKQLEKEKIAADEKVRIAQLELSTNDTNVELKVAYQQALLEQIDLEERIAGQKSEQMTNEVGLNEELAEAQNTLALARVGARELEMLSLEQDYAAKLELARKAGDDGLEIDEQYRQLQLELQARYKEEDAAVQEEEDIAEEDKRKKKIESAKASFEMASALLVQEGQIAMSELEAQQKTELELFSGTEAELKKLEEKQAKEKHKLALKNWKTESMIAIASTTIATAEGVVQAIKGSAGLGPTGVALGYLQAGLVLATGLKNIQIIKKSKPSMSPPKPESGGAASGGGGGSSASAGTDSLSELAGSQSITEQFTNQFGNNTQEPVQAYVVEQQVTQSQQINTMIQQKATL